MNRQSPAEAASLAAYREFLARTYRSQFGIRDRAWTDHVADSWFACDQRHDHRFREMRDRVPGSPRFLDLASGMGSAVLRALRQGLDGYGIEPDAEKLSLMRERLRTAGWPEAWASRFSRAVGEKLPFRNASFDCVLSYQTIEHVSDPEAVLAEMLRVVRPGGVLHLRCPDYGGTYEGHYLLPWLPLLPKRLARLYLRLLGRPVSGLEGIRYVTRGRILRWLRSEAEKAGLELTILDLERERLRASLRGRRLPGWKGPSCFWRILYHARRLFREEIQLNLWVAVRRA